MATRALQQVITYLAWNTSTNAYATGDSANHSTSWCKDGTRSATSNATAEVDATNFPGLYKVTMTSTETDCIEGTLGGKSSTANVVLIPTMIAFDYLNTSAPATAGIPDVNAKNLGNTAQTGRDVGANVLLSPGTGTGQISLSSGAVTVGTNNDKTGYSLTQGFPSNFSSLGISAAGKINEVVLVDTLTTYTSDTPQSGDAFLRLGVPVGASTSADIAAVKSDLDGGVAVASVQSGATNVKKNTAKNGFMFVMTDSTLHKPSTGLTVTANRSIDGGAFGACANSVTEVANGTYVINLAAADMNGDHIMLRMTAASTDDLNIEIVTQP